MASDVRLPWLSLDPETCAYLSFGRRKGKAVSGVAGLTNGDAVRTPRVNSDASKYHGLSCSTTDVSHENSFSATEPFGHGGDVKLAGASISHHLQDFKGVTLPGRASSTHGTGLSDTPQVRPRSKFVRYPAKEQRRVLGPIRNRRDLRTRLSEYHAGWHLRALFVRFRPWRLEEFSKSWNRHFAKIIPFSREPSTEWSPDERFLEAYASEWVNSPLPCGETIASIRAHWLKSSAQERQSRWQRLLLTMMKHQARFVSNVLVATYVEPFPPSYAVADVLHYVVTVTLKMKGASRSSVDEILETIAMMLSENRKFAMDIHQSTIFQILHHSDSHQVSRFYHILMKRGPEPVLLHENTMLQFLMRLSQEEDFSVVQDLLLRGLKTARDVRDPKILSACTSVLKAAARDPSASTIMWGTLDRLRKEGVAPNIIMATLIYQTALRCNDTDNLWRIYQLSREHDLQSDPHVYSVLLNAAKQRLDTPAIHHLLASMSHDNSHQDAHVQTDLLHATHLIRNTGSERAPAFFALLAQYLQSFSDEPLRDLHLLHLPLPLFPSSSSKPLPAPITFGVVLTHYLKNCRDPALNEVHLGPLYERYAHLVAVGHPVIAPLAETDHVATAFISALSRSPACLPLCSRILADCSTRGIVSAQAHTTLMAGYMRHRKGTDTAAVLRDMLRRMDERGTRPDHATWTVLVRMCVHFRRWVVLAMVEAEMGLDGVSIDAIVAPTHIAGLGTWKWWVEQGREEIAQKLRGEKGRWLLSYWSDEAIVAAGLQSEDETWETSVTEEGKPRGPPTIEKLEAMRLGTLINRLWVRSKEDREDEEDGDPPPSS
ncbi:MAG: hypothetical protein M1833_006096 [Piccolia ochrophora]|nr:MAG: hypothetical protein M1833_006096 [Piccolia ochrophora]